ncbi:MAG: hypothetical protein QOK42_886 [Frankiaceae bacterium]|jgi:Tfp pilus assembly protein PilO|nr:hypothetical protein [Frankiaceae bacterium]MDX6225544.1 hypothetical protein [Frankiales bacterium]MDX6274871.1 hypothetical protein [Frankiales bacterium]
MAKLRNHVAIAGLLALVMLAAGWFLLVSPQRSKAAGFRDDAAQTRSASSALQTQLALLKSQAKQLPKQQARLHAIATKVPSNPAEPALLRMLTKAASDSGVDLSSVAPAPPALIESTRAAAPSTAPGAPVASAPVTTAGPRVATIALAITAVGTYYELEQFQANLENLSRALKTVGIAFKPGGAASQVVPGAGTSSSNAYDGKITATISANVYMTVEAASVAPLTGAGQPAPKK